MAEQKFCSYNSLVEKIRDAVRDEARMIRGFKDGNGSIRVSARPCTTEADKFLGGLSNFEINDITNYDEIFTITPGGSHTMIANVGDEAVKVNCYGYSALKIASAELARKRGVGLMSGLDVGDDKDLVEANGWSPYAGAVCVEVRKKYFVDGRSGEGVIANNYEFRDFLRIFIAVSGASDREDLRCARAGIGEIEKFFAVKDRKGDGPSPYIIRFHGHPEFKTL